MRHWQCRPSGFAATRHHRLQSSSTVGDALDRRGKRTCASFGNFNKSITVGSIANGIYDDIVEIYGFDGEKFNWRLVPSALHAYDMGVVLVKGGPSDLEKYVYDYAGGGLDDYDEGSPARRTRRTAVSSGRATRSSASIQRAAGRPDPRP